MPNKTTPKVTSAQKIENLLNHIHALQDRLDENKRIITEQNEIIAGQREIIDGYRLKADGYKDKFEALQMKLEMNHAAAIQEPRTTERGRHPRRLWQTRRRRP